MIRYAYIQSKILKLYQAIGRIEYPIDPLSFFSKIKDSRAITYQEFAAINQCTVEDVIVLCESKSGCTHYNIASNRYLCLYNASSNGNNVGGRIRWTKAHELAHVVLEHLPYIAVSQIAENNFNNVSDPELEREADYFAATLLSPFPVFEALNIQSYADVQNTFGLSEEASKNRISQYFIWRKSRVKTAWENDMKKLVLRGIDNTSRLIETNWLQ